jgi:hypothetical protein
MVKLRELANKLGGQDTAQVVRTANVIQRAIKNHDFGKDVGGTNALQLFIFLRLLHILSWNSKAKERAIAVPGIVDDNFQFAGDAQRDKHIASCLERAIHARGQKSNQR